MLYAQHLGEQQDGNGGSFSLFDIAGDSPYNGSTVGFNKAIEIGVSEIRYTTQPSPLERAKQLNLMLRHGVERKDLTIEKRGNNFIWVINKFVGDK